jgi:molybdopterin-guanine dinucleotide biosynthesis protein A
VRVGGIVLCGGKSSRMGRPKAWLPVGGEVMLQRVVRILRDAVSPVLVVAAPRQELPPLPAEVVVIRDKIADRGPLQGFAAGLEALDGWADAVYLSGCDAPLLKPAFIRRMADLLGADAACVPLIAGRAQFFAGVYRVSVLETVRHLLAADRRSMTGVLVLVSGRLVPAAELVDVDPDLDSLRNVNTPEAYAAALKVLSSEC